MKHISRRRAALWGSAWVAAFQMPLLAACAAPRVVVAFGDSITDGVGASVDSQQPMSYPDRLAERLRAKSGQAVTVINAGIPGNRLLADGFGPKGMNRFERDALTKPGVSHVLILIGINDIGMSMPEGALAPTLGLPTAEEMTEGLQRLIGQAQSHGVKVLLGTLLPFKGSGYWSPEKELRREAVNRWIRSRRNVEAVVDFDALMRDPADPQALKPAYDCGDHLHPGTAGYVAMADAIDLRTLGC